MNSPKQYWIILFFTVIIYCFSSSELVQGFDNTVEFNNKSLPHTMSTEKYFKDLSSDEEEVSVLDVPTEEKDGETHLHGKRRTKRFITYNVLAPIDIGLLLAIPITLILPSISNLFNKRVKRSLPMELGSDIYEDEPIVQTHLDRISNYFELLQVKSLFFSKNFQRIL